MTTRDFKPGNTPEYVVNARRLSNEMRFRIAGLTEEETKFLVPLLADENPDARVYAFTAFEHAAKNGQNIPVNVLSILARAEEDKNSGVRESASKALDFAIVNQTEAVEHARTQVLRLAEVVKALPQPSRKSRKQTI